MFQLLLCLHTLSVYELILLGLVFLDQMCSLYTTNIFWGRDLSRSPCWVYTLIKKGRLKQDSFVAWFVDSFSCYSSFLIKFGPPFNNINDLFTVYHCHKKSDMFCSWHNYWNRPILLHTMYPALLMGELFHQTKISVPVIEQMSSKREKMMYTFKPNRFN